MVRGEAASGKRNSRGQWGGRKRGLGALLVLSITGTGILSGCAGLANSANTNPTPSAIQITPAALTFPTVNVGQQATQTATLTNTGSKSVSITQLSSSSAEFSTSGLAMPLTLAPGQSAQFKVAFKTSTVGTVSGELTAMTSHGGDSTRVKLKGNAGKTGAQLALSTTSLSYGSVLVNGKSTR